LKSRYRSTAASRFVSGRSEQPLLRLRGDASGLQKVAGARRYLDFLAR
jgi:hypothetical protein